MLNLIFLVALFIPCVKIFVYIFVCILTDCDDNISRLSLKLTIIHSFSFIVCAVFSYFDESLPINIFKIIIIILSVLILFIDSIIYLINS